LAEIVIFSQIISQALLISTSDRVGSLMTILREVSRYKLDLVRWEGGGTKPAGEYTLFYGKGNDRHELGTGFFVHKKIISAVKKV
jgi:hypothetical protein